MAEPRPNYPEGSVTLVCQECFGEFVRVPVHGIPPRATCSNRCRQRRHRRRLRLADPARGVSVRKAEVEVQRAEDEVRRADARLTKARLRLAKAAS